MNRHQLLLLAGIVICVQSLEQSEDGGLERKRLRREPLQPVPKPETGTQQATWRLTARANKYFAHRLFSNIVRHEDEGNIVISPFVVSTGLSMTLLGARGRTEAELMRTLDYSNIGYKKSGDRYNRNDVPRLYRLLIKNLRNSAMHDGYALKLACRLYGEQSEEFRRDFLQNTERYYGAKLKELDFRNQPENSRQQINQWVSNKTEGTITEALPYGTVTSTTLIALVSSIYFKGEWKTKFNVENTYSGTFKVDDTTRIPTQFMHQELALQYRVSKKAMAHVLILPYENSASSYSTQMELYLPVEEGTLPRIEQMNEEDFHHSLREMSVAMVDLHLPKFSIEYSIDMRGALERLGILSLFSGADLSGMNGKKNLNFGSVIHKAFLQVNEEGTTASASQVITMNRSVMRHVEIRFDHPFVFIIREKSTNSILFFGRITRPN